MKRDFLDYLEDILDAMEKADRFCKITLPKNKALKPRIHLQCQGKGTLDAHLTGICTG